MNLVIDTRTLPPDVDRVAAWEAATAHCFGSFSAYLTRGRDNLSSRIEVGQVEDALISRMTMSATEVEWARAGDGHTERETIGLMVGITGEIGVHRPNYSGILRPGEVCLTDSQTRYRGTYTDGTDFLILMLPRHRLEDRIGPVAPLDGVTMSADLPSTRLIRSYVSALMATSSHSLDAHVEADAVRIAIDMIVFGLSEATTRAPKEVHAPATIALLRVDQALTQHLRNPAATAPAIAAASGVSLRYANQLLAEQGSSVMRELTNRRLEKVAHDLSMSVNADRSISQIAQHWGFQHMSRFSSRFREHFGVSPREYRQRASEAAP